MAVYLVAASTMQQHIIGVPPRSFTSHSSTWSSSFQLHERGQAAKREDVGLTIDSHSSHLISAIALVASTGAPKRRMRRCIEDGAMCANFT